MDIVSKETVVAPAELVPEPEVIAIPESEAALAPAPKEDWRDKRIAALTAKLKAQSSPAPAMPAPTLAVAMPGTPEYQAVIEAEAKKIATQQVALQSFNEKCNATADAGRKIFSDFDEKISSLRSIIDSNDPKEVAEYNDLLFAAIETGEGPKILHTLGSDLNAAQKLLSLSPVKLGIELAKLALAKPVGNQEISNAPKPITPVGKNNTSEFDIFPDDPDKGEKLSTSEWMKRRNQQVRKK